MVPGFEDALREFMLGTLQITCAAETRRSRLPAVACPPHAAPAPPAAPLPALAIARARPSLGTSPTPADASRPPPPSPAIPRPVSLRRYQAVPVAHVQASLGLSDAAALKKLVSSKGWTVEGDVVKISINDDNTAKPKKVDVSGAMGYDQMTKILSSIAS